MEMLVCREGCRESKVASGQTVRKSLQAIYPRVVPLTLESILDSSQSRRVDEDGWSMNQGGEDVEV